MAKKAAAKKNGAVATVATGTEVMAITMVQMATTLKTKKATAVLKKKKAALSLALANANQ